MDGNSYTSYSYRLRASGIMAVGEGIFILQSFGGERNTVRTYEATTTINNSVSMAGASPTGIYVSATWNRLPYLTENCKQIFSGNTISKPVFIHETQIPGS